MLKRRNATYSDWQLYKKLCQHIHVHALWILLIVFAMLLTAAIDPIFAWFLKIIIDKSLQPASTLQHLLYPSILFILFLLRAIFAYISTSGNAHVVYRLVEHLRNRLFAHIQHLPFNTLKQYGTPALLSRVTYDALQVSELGLNALSILIRDGLTIIGLCALLLWYSPLLSLLVVCVIPLIWLSVYLCKRMQRDLGLHIQEEMGTLSTLLTEGIQLQESIRVFQGEHIEQERLEKQTRCLRKMHIQQISVGAINSSAVQLFVGIALCLIVYFGAIFSQHGTFTIGTFISFVTAMILLFQPFRRITTVGYILQRGLAAAESIFHILDLPTEKINATNRMPKHPSGRVSFDAVSFSYPNTTQAALHHVSFTIESGERVALVGESGCGKSTLLRLLLGFYTPNSGHIYIDDVDINTIAPHELRRVFTLVSQDAHLFNKTVKDNIAYGEHTLSDPDSIHSALHRAQALDFVDTLPNGLSSVIGDNGQLLSGGQRQRLQIARAFLKPAPILLLDEATSALDADTESRILWRSPHQQTSLFVTHRLHLAAHCDRIFVFHHGLLVGTGTHQCLLTENAYYLHLYNMSRYQEKETDQEHS